MVSAELEADKKNTEKRHWKNQRLEGYYSFVQAAIMFVRLVVVIGRTVVQRRTLKNRTSVLFAAERTAVV